MHTGILKQTNWPSFLPLQSLGLNFEGCSLLRSSQRHHGHCNTVDVWLLCTEPHMHEFFLSTQNRKLVLIVAPVFQFRGVKYPYVCIYCICRMVFCLSLFILSRSWFWLFCACFYQVTKKDVRAALKTRLPFYMIPSHFVFLARFVYYISLKTSKKICCINAI